MKLSRKKISLLVIVIIFTAVIFACNPEEGDTIDNNGDPTDNNIKTVEISSVEKVSLENLTLLDEYTIDFNEDSKDEKISMYTAAERGLDGEIMWDDGQRWLFVVHSDDKDYVLFDDYVQLGTIDFQVYTMDDDFYIFTINSGTANLTLTEFKFHPEKDVFIKTVPFNTLGNVNKFYTSFGY